MSDSKTFVYVGVPRADRHPQAAQWLCEHLEEIERDSYSGPEHRIVQLEYDGSASLNIRNTVSRIRSLPGPVLLLRPVQQRLIDELQASLRDRAVVIARDVVSPACIPESVFSLIEGFEAGEPMLPQKLILALLLVRKLERNNMWTGKNKGYMWRDDLANGRGYPKEFAEDIPDLLAALTQSGLVEKKTSKGKSKFALCPDRRPEIHAALRDLCFEASLQKVFLRDHRLLSARYLDVVTDT